MRAIKDEYMYRSIVSIPSKKFSERRLLDGNGRKRMKNTRCSFHCNCLILEEVARPERFELPAFWFVTRSSKTSKCRYWYRLRAKRATLFCLELDGSWTEQFKLLAPSWSRAFVSNSD